MDCVFCDIEKSDYILENDYGFVIYDKYPVNKGHMLIIPKRHFPSYFDCTDDEIIGLNDLLQKARMYLKEKFDPDGYNIGINISEAGGQTIFHLHIHLIPRELGDVEDPRGGIRNLKEQLVSYKG